jgi:SAM-dependent methyltransferase
MRYRNKHNINLIDNPLKTDLALLNRKNALESQWYDQESESYFAELNKSGELIAMDKDFESWFGSYYDKPEETIDYDRGYRFFSALANKQSASILEIGFGDGCLSRLLLRRNRNVVSVDIAGNACRFLKQSDQRSIPIRSCGEILPFKNNSFDIVTSLAALHHLNLDLALGEIKRVLKDDGVGIFLEPIYNSEMLYKIRQLIPIDDNESPGGGGFRKKNLVESLKAQNLEFTIEEFEVFTRLERLIPTPKARRILRKFDYAALRLFPRLRYFARSFVLIIQKKPV